MEGGLISLKNETGTAERCPVCNKSSHHVISCCCPVETPSEEQRDGRRVSERIWKQEDVGTAVGGASGEDEAGRRCETWRETDSQTDRREQESPVSLPRHRTSGAAAGSFNLRLTEERSNTEASQEVRAPLRTLTDTN